MRSRTNQDTTIRTSHNPIKSCWLTSHTSQSEQVAIGTTRSRNNSQSEGVVHFAGLTSYVVVTMMPPRCSLDAWFKLPSRPPPLWGQLLDSLGLTMCSSLELLSNSVMLYLLYLFFGKERSVLGPPPPMVTSWWPYLSPEPAYFMPPLLLPFVDLSQCAEEKRGRIQAALTAMIPTNYRYSLVVAQQT